jgi:hypothetical protein
MSVSTEMAGYIIFTMYLISDYVAYQIDYFAVIIFCEIPVSPVLDLKGVNS